MPDRRLNVTERRLQPWFSKWLFVLGFLLLARDSRDEGPNRLPQPPRLATVSYERQGDGKSLASGVRLTDVWRVEADDPRFGGLSALVAAGGKRLLALSDSSVLVDLPLPTAAERVARLADLPSGPGYPLFRKHRDSEALLAKRLPDGGTLLHVAFEHRHSIWSYRLGAPAAEGWVRLAPRGWRSNAGVEAMVEGPRGRLLLIPEDGAEVLAMEQGRVTPFPLTGATGGVADAALLPDGRIVVSIREVGIGGITNRLALLERVGRGYRLRPFVTLPLGPFDNVEGLAAESMPGGGTTLWAVTDSDGWRRTLLLRIEL
jgi:hypothetical protein